MADELTNLRLNIDGRWSAAEMATCLQATSDLYAIRQALSLVAKDSQDTRIFVERVYLGRGRGSRAALPYRRLAGISQFPPAESADALIELLEPRERLRVRAVCYGSEGFKDLTGIGVAIGHLKDLIIKLVEIGIGRKRRRIEEDGMELDNESKRLRNARDYVALAKEAGYSESEVRQLILWVDKRQITLVGLAEQGKLVGVNRPSSKDGLAENK